MGRKKSFTACPRIFRVDRARPRGRGRRERGRERERVGREPWTPGDRGGQHREETSHDGDRKRAVREAKRVLEPEDPEQERRILLVGRDAVRREWDAGGDGEQADREQAGREPRGKSPLEVKAEPGQN